jgi:hypothetical protein
MPDPCRRDRCQGIGARSVPGRYQVGTRSVPGRYQVPSSGIPLMPNPCRRDRYQVGARSLLLGSRSGRIPAGGIGARGSVPGRYQVPSSGIPLRPDPCRRDRCQVRLLGLLLPHPRYRYPTESASPILHVVLQNRVPLPLHDHLLASVTIRMLTLMPRDVADVHVVHPLV